MSFPTGLTTRTVTLTYVNADGTPASGEVILRHVAVVAYGDQFLTAAPVAVRLAAGAGSVEWACGDDPGLAEPAYTEVTERLVGVPDRIYVVQIPQGPGALALADAPRVVLPSRP